MKRKSPHLQKFITNLAVDSGKILLKHFRKKLHIEHKKNAGIVTQADKASEKFLMKQIYSEFPGSSILTEETGEHQGGKTWWWILDPLDGTSNYAHGFPWFCVSIGLHFEGKPKAGCIYNPVTSELFYVEKGKGSKLNGKKISVSKTRKLKDSLLGTGFYYCRGDDLRREIEIFNRVNQEALGVRRPGSAALDLAYVACGRYDGFWERGLSAWDVAAGNLMVEEAGGTISNYKGGETGVHTREVVASNKIVHSQLISAIGS